jgi:hypothetical protein
MDRLEAMSIFLTVVEIGSLSAAARRLHAPLATVSRKVSDLESHLRTKLFNRSSHKLVLTEAGSSYVAACKRILADAPARGTGLQYATRSGAGQCARRCGRCGYDRAVRNRQSLGLQTILFCRADGYCSNLAFRRGAAKSRNARSLIGRNRPATYTRLTGQGGGSKSSSKVVSVPASRASSMR